MLLPGHALGRYRVERHIGTGGMGSVYLARDEVLDRRVALKVIPTASAAPIPGRETVTFPPRADADDHEEAPADARRLARFLREGRAAAALHHPNVVTVFDVGEVDGVPYLAMEYVDGASLRAYVARVDHAELSLERRVGLLRDVARALAAAHARGIVHRDVKPENVLVAQDGTAKVADFGIAKLEPRPDGDRDGTTLTGPGGVVGTPGYMSPEQVRGAAIDARTDQFAWGVVAFELLSGTHPFTRGVPTATVAAILEDAVADLRSLAPTVPAHVARVIARALAKEPAERFAGFDDVLRALDGGAGAARPRQRGVLTVIVAVASAATLSGILFARTRAMDASAPAAGRPDPAPGSAEARPTPSAAASSAPSTSAIAEASSVAPGASTAPTSRPSRPASPAAAKAPASAVSAPSRCTPPYDFDADGNKKWKLECL
jgi:serine/threonine-protein kinase